MQNQEPEKWREGIDPYGLPLQTVQIRKILGYPHAANQVFYLKGMRNGNLGYYYLKYAHHKDANFRNEIQTIHLLQSPLAPQVVEFDSRNYQYLLTEQIQGKRLSGILAETGSENSLDYMYEYGKTLAELHHAVGNFEDAPNRRFHALPDRDECRKLGLLDVYTWLLEHKPALINRCFVHGDFHYANILWQDGKISGILDFELAGMGNREFDIAWSLILRPGQNFLKTEAERERFLTGYTSTGSCDRKLITYYMVLIYARFLKFGDECYEQYVRDYLKKAVHSQNR